MPRKTAVKIRATAYGRTSPTACDRREAERARKRQRLHQQSRHVNRSVNRESYPYA